MRLGTTHDLPSAVEIWRSALAGQGRRPSAALLSDITAQLTASLFVIGDDAMAAGVENPDVAGDLLLSLVAVAPANQRQGRGAAAVEALADAAWNKGLRTMSTWTDAPGFLEAIGLSRTGRAKDSVVELTAELEAPIREVLVKAEGIRLGQLLKLAELVETGAEAKALLAEESVEVNGEVETRRGRQLADGDEIRAHDQAVRVVLTQT